MLTKADLLDQKYSKQCKIFTFKIKCSIIDVNTFFQNQNIFCPDSLKNRKYKTTAFLLKINIFFNFDQFIVSLTCKLLNGGVYFVI